MAKVVVALVVVGTVVVLSRELKAIIIARRTRRGTGKMKPKLLQRSTLTDHWRSPQKQL